MTVLEYSDLILETRDLLFSAIGELLLPETDKEKRFIQTGTQTEDKWLATLQNESSGKIQMFVLIMKNFNSVDLARTAGAKNFKSQITFTAELFHDYEFGTDAKNSEDVFLKEAISLQFAIETNRNLSEKAFIEKYTFDLGIRPSNVRSLHIGRGEITVSFREIRY